MNKPDGYKGWPVDAVSVYPEIWDVPRPAETLDEALDRLEDGERCRHCGAPILVAPLSGKTAVWKHTNNMYTCDLPEKYGLLGKDSIQFAEPKI